MEIATLTRSACAGARVLVRPLTTAAAVFAIGLLNPPAVHVALAAAAATPVAVDQQPLTLRPQIPPDIVLMLDDSGSMAWDFMPDASYLTGETDYTDESRNTSAYVPADALRSSSVNGTYYDGGTTYSPPPKADGSSYPTPTTLGSAYDNPFDSAGTTVDLTQALSQSLCSYNPSNGSYVLNPPCPASIKYAFPYFTAFPSASSGSNSAYAPTCASGYTLNSGYCFKTGSRVKAPTCNAGDSYNGATWYCETGSPTYTYLFTYTTPGASAGTYVRHYVGKSSADCGKAPANTCVYDAATQKNVATWFSYYRTRILMAKSGLMSAFSTLDPKFRVGFGSIDGNNDTALSSLTTHTYNSKTIAAVAPFGKTTDSTSQRINFWNWVAGESASSGTPLRQALDAVGQYYSDDAAEAWTTMASDPVPADTAPLACRQAYSILTTDGFWNGSWNKGPGNVDGTAGPKIDGPNLQTYKYKAVQPYSDSNDDTLADVAMQYWSRDLQPKIDNEVTPSTDDPAFWQHMATFTMGLGFTPTGIKPDGTTIDQVFNWAVHGTPLPISGNFSWPTPAADSINNIADLAHAGLNGHGGFFSATDPQSFTSGITNALKRATERVGTGASLAANSTQLQTGTAVFQANYFTAVWKGDLKSLSVNPGTGAIATTPTWSAGNVMPTAANRTIKSYNTATGTFVDFQNSGGSPPALSATQLAALDPSGANNSANEKAIVDYLRGDASQEQKSGGNYRSRDSALGDVVDSQPVYVGAPNANEFVGRTFAGYSYDPNNASSTAPFHDWAVGTTDNSGKLVASAASTRTPLVYVAANDGMLHAFNASTGVEVFAYLPGALLVNSTDPYAGVSEPLANLANPAYGGDSVPHQFYNDGELTVADAYLTLGGSTGWHTILVGTTGRGPARAVYALDVTDPSNIKPLWERYANDGSSLDSNSGYIGEIVGKPVIAQTGDYGTNPAWSVLIGNGYNSPKGTAALLQFDLATGQLYAHTTDNSTGNGLAAPVAWMDYPSSGMSDVAYAGDLLGRMWSFPLITIKTTGQGTSYTPNTTGSGTSLFTAKNASNVVQPITGGTIAGQNPKDHSVWVFFGTGKYLTNSDVSSTTVNSWYGLEVQSSPGGGNVVSSGRSDLVQRQIIAEQAGTSSPLRLPVRAVTLKPGTDDMSGKNGWYMDLVSPLPNGVDNPTAQGERMVVPNQFQGNLLLGTTRIPKPSANTDVCNPAGGGWIMAIDPFTGTNPGSNFFDTNGDGSINGTDTITVDGQQVPVAGVGFTSLPNAPIFVGVDMLVSFDNGTTSTVKTAASAGGYNRVSWQEVVVP